MSPDELIPSAEELLALQADLDALEEYKKENPLLFFRPNVPQLRMTGSNATYRTLFGGNKVGKTTWGKIEDISYCLGYRPFLPKNHPLFKTPYEPPVKGMCFCETWDKADEVVTPHFEKWLPRGVAKEIRRHGRTVGWEFTNGSEIRYGTYEMDPDRMEGADKHFYDFDEPPPYSFWAPITRGVIVDGGKIWMTLTLLSEGWIWDEIWERAEAGDPDYFAITGDIRDNLRTENADGTVTGALDEAAIQRFEKTLDDVQKEVRLHGKPQHLQGRIFKHFAVKEPWVTEEWDIPREWPSIRAIDPHLGKPHAVVWAKVSPTNRLIITDVLFDASIQNLKQLAERMGAIEKARNHKVAMSLMDSSFNVRDVSGESMMDLFRKAGIACTAAPKADKRARLMATAEMFKLDEEWKQPGIVMFKSCERLIWEIKRYVHPELRGSARSRGNQVKEYPEGRDKKDDDLIDGVLYLVSQKPNYRALKTGYRTYRPSMDENDTRNARTVHFAEPYNNRAQPQATEATGGY